MGNVWKDPEARASLDARIEATVEDIRTLYVGHGGFNSAKASVEPLVIVSEK